MTLISMIRGSEESHSHHEEEHHCHVGHLHHVVYNGNDTDISPSKTEILIAFPVFQFGNIQSFSTYINRPPIS